MRLLRTALTVIVALLLVVLALANRQAVTLRLVPSELADAIDFAPSLTLPVFAVVLFGIMIGLLLGVLGEWLREHKHRVAVTQSQAEVGRLKRDIRRAKKQQGEDADEILALLEK